MYYRLELKRLVLFWVSRHIPHVHIGFRNQSNVWQISSQVGKTLECHIIQITPPLEKPSIHRSVS